MNQGIRIGLVLPAVPGYSETFIYTKINGLLDLGYKVSLFVSGKRLSNDRIQGIPIYFQINIGNIFYILSNLIVTFIFHPLLCIRFLSLERDSHGDYTKALKNLIINTHIIGKSLDWLHFCFATTGIGRENLARTMGAKSAVSFRGFDIGLYPNQHSGCFNQLWQKIDKVHTISEDLYRKAVKLGLDQSVSYEKITPAINTDFFKSDSNKDLHEPLRILTVGRLHWKKGYEYALKALSILKEKQINFEYHIVGDGYYKEAIVYAIHQLQLTDNVQLVGKISPEEVKDEMERADIYIQSSIQEGFCNAVLEAQAMGLLCVVTDAEGLSENILDKKTGWVVPKRSPDKIAERIVKILSKDSKERDKIRESAVDRVQNKFNLIIQNNQFQKFYN